MRINQRMRIKPEVAVVGGLPARIHEIHSSFKDGEPEMIQVVTVKLEMERGAYKIGDKVDLYPYELEAL
jgi:hypothetical protein